MVNNATNINNNLPPQISEHTKDSLMVNNVTNINNNLPPQIIEHKIDTTIYTDRNTASGLGPAQNYCRVTEEDPGKKNMFFGVKS